MKWFLGSRLMSAINEEDLPRIADLLAKAGDADIRLNSGRTPLHYAISLRKDKAVALLIEKGANFERTDDWGMPPLHSAAYRNNLNAIVLLLKAGADPNLRDNDGMTAHGRALKSDCVEIADILKPYMRAAREEFDLPPAPAARVPELRQPAALPEGWVKLGAQQVARSLGHEQLGYRLTDVFDFAARERIRIVNNMATRQDHVETVSFDSLPDKGLLEDALKNLRALGGTADEAAIHGGPAKPKLPSPGA